MGQLGSLVALGAGSAIHALTPKSKLSEPPNTYSGNYGIDVFPFHTDLAHHRNPPRYLILRCIKGYESVTTPLVDSEDLLSQIGEATLGRALVRSRRRVRGEASLMRLYESTKAGKRFRWDQLFLVPASEHGQQVFRQVEEVIRAQEALHLSLADPGDTLVLDNWRILHSRSNVPEAASDRVVARAYLEELS